MQEHLADIELDIQELKCLMNVYLREPSHTLREVLKRNITQMQARLNAMLKELDVVQPPTDRIDMPVKEILPIIIEELPAKVEQASSSILGEQIKNATDFRRSFSLNDSFRFSRELFGGDVEQMNRVLEQLSEMTSLDMATAFLQSKVSVCEDNEAMVDFLERLNKYLINED